MIIMIKNSEFYAMFDWNLKNLGFIMSGIILRRWLLGYQSSYHTLVDLIDSLQDKQHITFNT